MVISIDPDQMPRSLESDMVVRCLLRHNCLNTYGEIRYDQRDLAPRLYFFMLTSAEHEI